jgi:hypothetical protein
MYLIDTRTRVIHDMSRPAYECHISGIPKEVIKKVYTIDTVKRMCDMDAIPRYTGCQWCMPDYFVFDMTKIY